MNFKDDVVALREDGTPIYDNTATVVAVAYKIHKYNFPGPIIPVIRRATNPGKGLLALPGGFQMRGESWQEAGIRELEEEVGLTGLNPDRMIVDDIYTDHYKNNIVFAHYNQGSNEVITPDYKNEDEVMEMILVDQHNFHTFVGHWAFDSHMLYTYQTLFEKDE